VRNPAALFSSRQQRMSTVKIGSGCLVWVRSVEKLSKNWNPCGMKATPLATRRFRRVAAKRRHQPASLVTGRHQAFFGPGFYNLQLGDGYATQAVCVRSPFRARLDFGTELLRLGRTD
jgi:hypothetical protein